MIVRVTGTASCTSGLLLSLHLNSKLGHRATQLWHPFPLLHEALTPSLPSLLVGACAFLHETVTALITHLCTC